MSQSINNQNSAVINSTKSGQKHGHHQGKNQNTHQSAATTSTHTTSGLAQLDPATLQSLIKLIEEIINSLQSLKERQEQSDSQGKRINGSQCNDRLKGTRKDDVINGRHGNDLIKGKKGNDTLYGGRGSDLLKGGAGQDVLNGGSGGDRLFGGRGADKLFGGSGWDFLNGGFGDDKLFGGAGNDVLTDNSGINHINGGSGHDILKFLGAFADYDISYSGNEFTITHLESGAVNHASNVESFQFSDTSHSARSLQQSIQASPYYGIDGSNNNISHPEYGKTESTFLRPLGHDSTREPGGSTEAHLPSARTISNAVSSQSGNTENHKGLSDMFWLWGQFLDHDINHTSGNDNDSANMAIPMGDPWFDPQSSGNLSMIFNRSDSSIDSSGNRQQHNTITAFIDGSNVYGSDPELAAELRSYDAGKLKTGTDNLLPTATDSNQFQAGDVRVNEHGGLTSMHTLWMREHNRVAEQFAQQHPDWNDEQLYQEARSTVIAEMQAITYNEFLPELLGENVLGAYQGYDAEVDPQISNAFATAAYRFGHSMLSPTLLRLDESGAPIEQGNLSLREAFFQPETVKEAGIEPFLRGFATQTAQALDPVVVDDVRNFLFGAPGQGGFDLAALNIQRGRDHGLPSYNESRIALGLEPIISFDDQIFADDFGQKMAQVYASPDDIDLWVGGLAEAPSDDALVGETMSKIMTDQFERLRSGDRLWFENRYSGEQLAELNKLSLSDIIRRNTDIQNIQDHVMLASDRTTQPSAVQSQSTNPHS